MDSNPGIDFLGLCERASCVREGSRDIFKWNILGLKHILLSYIFPFDMKVVTLGFAINPNTLQNTTNINIIDHDGSEVGKLKLELSDVQPTIEEKTINRNGLMISPPKVGSITSFTSLS